MSHKEDLALMAHLMRRVGFGASREELEQLVAQGYEATVEELIDPPQDRPAGKTACCYGTSLVACYQAVIRYRGNLAGCIT